MPQKQSPLTRSNSKSHVLLFTLFLLVFFPLFILFSHTRNTYSDPHPYPNTKPETSFVVSLEHFLTQKFARLYPAKDDTVSTVGEGDVRRFDDLVFKNERKRVYTEFNYPLNFPIKVYVYEMPKKFTYDLLWLFRGTYKETSNLTSNGSPVHRLIEQHSIDYWLWVDLIAPESERLLTNVVRVHRQEEADLFYIPFFTTISFFLMEKQQCKALYRVKL